MNGKTIYALFVYHREKYGYEKWEYRREVETGNATIFLEQLFEKVFGYQVAGGSHIDTTVIINDIRFKDMHVVYGGGYELVLAKRIKQ